MYELQAWGKWSYPGYLPLDPRALLTRRKSLLPSLWVWIRLRTYFAQENVAEVMVRHFPSPARSGLQHFLCSHAPLLPPWECTRLTLGSRATLLWPTACWLPDTPGSPAEARKTTQTTPLTHKVATYPWASDSSLQHDCGNRKLKDDPTKSRSTQQRLPHSPLRSFSWHVVSVHSSPLCPSDFSLQLFTDGLSCPCYLNTPDLTSPSNVVQIRIALGPLVIHGLWFKTISCSKLRKQYMFIARK